MRWTERDIPAFAVGYVRGYDDGWYAGMDSGLEAARELREQEQE